MSRKVMIAPVGFEIDRVTEAQKFEPCNIWYILRNPKQGSDFIGEYGLPLADKVVEKIAKFPLQEFQVIEVRQSNLLVLVHVFVEIIKRERKEDPEVEFVINMSSSTKTAEYAAALVAGFCPSPVKQIYLRPKQEMTLAELLSSPEKKIEKMKEFFLNHGECHAPFELEYFPVIPYASLTNTQRLILEDLAVYKIRETLSSLVEIINPNSKEPSQKDFVKIGWSVKALEKMHLLKTRKTHLSKSVIITPEGEIVAAALNMLHD